jgi:hypothetical protein
MTRRKLRHELVLPRRTMLRGVVAGTAVALGLPLLDVMTNENGDGLASGAPLPLRLLTWMWGVGVRLEHWVPKDTGSSYTLSAELQPLKDYKEKFTLLSGFKNYVAGRRGHHDGMAGLFSGHPFIALDPMGAPYASKFGGPSIDQVAADLMSEGAMFKSLQIGVTKRHLKDQGPTLMTMSHRGPDQPIDMERDPQKLYEKMFTAFMPKNDPADPMNGVRTAALDAVMSDAKRLQKRVSTADKKRLDHHLESLFDLQKQILAIPPNCDLPLKPDPIVFDNNPEPLAQINAVMSKLVALAFSCNLTHVASYMFTAPSGGQQYATLTPDKFPQYPGAVDLSHASEHETSHTSSEYEQTYIHQATIIDMQQFAVTLKALDDTQEGGGTLLDNMCVLAGTDVCEGWNHSEDDYPIIVAGKAGGRLKQGVGHYRSPGAVMTMGESLSNVGMACLKAVVPNPDVITVYGSDLKDGATTYKGRTTTPCAAILV